MTIWFDVEDLIRYFQGASRPTGIQRLSFETYRAVWQQAGATGKVGFCRRNLARTGFKSIHFPALEAGITAAATSAPTPPAPPASPPQQRPPSRLVTAARRLPPQFRRPLRVMAHSGLQALRATRELTKACVATASPGPAPANRIGGHQFDLHGPDVAFGPGDWFVNLGASWDSPYEPEFLAGLRANGTGFALLAHDLIPELFPEWCTQRMVSDFSGWLRDVVPQTDLMFAVSRNTAADLASCLHKMGKSTGMPVVLPVGSHAAADLAVGPPVLERPYVLMVGTIEARKNHAAMMRVWRRMLQTMQEAAVPDLVFAGKTGWLTTDLMQQLDNAGWFGGKIRFIESPSEADLASLYRHCLFSVFPSLYEGWGLPVTESLSFGKTVAASNRASIPEAGGAFCAYFDPDSITGAYETIRGLIENPEHIAALQARIAAEFHPPSWHDTAAALLARLGLQEQDVQADVKGLQTIS
jgi:glycosyltransferase involved in cell wall biosynthesis